MKRFYVRRSAAWTAFLIGALLLAAGCGLAGTGEGEGAPADTAAQAGAPEAGAAPADTPATDPAASDDNEDLEAMLARLFRPESAMDFAARFEALSYRWTTRNPSPEDVEFHFEWLGKAEHDGIPVDHLRLAALSEVDPETSDTIQMWVDADGHTVKALFSDGEAVPDMVADMLIRHLIGVVVMPFNQFDAFFGDPIRNGELTVASYAAAAGDVAGIPATLHSYVLRGNVPGHTDVEMEVDVASFAGLDLALRAEMRDGSGGFTLTPLEIVFR